MLTCTSMPALRFGTKLSLFHEKLTFIDFNDLLPFQL